MVACAVCPVRRGVAPRGAPGRRQAHRAMASNKTTSQAIIRQVACRVRSHQRASDDKVTPREPRHAPDRDRVTTSAAEACSRSRSEPPRPPSHAPDRDRRHLPPAESCPRSRSEASLGRRGDPPIALRTSPRPPRHAPLRGSSRPRSPRHASDRDLAMGRAGEERSRCVKVV